MKRLSASLFALLIFLTSAAFAEDYKNVSNDDLYALLNAVRTELLSRELSLTPAQVFIETDRVAMYMDKKDIEFTSNGTLKIPVILVNNTENEISFQIDSLMVNGWECSGAIGNIQTIGKKRATIDLHCGKGAEVSAIDEIEDICVAFLAFNMDTYKREVTTKPILLVIENGQLVRK